MFAIASRPEFTHTVPVLTPVDNGHREDTLRARFLAITQEEQRELLSDDPDGGALLRRVLVGAEDVVDADGRQVPWSDDLREQLIGLPWARLGLVAAYVRAVGKVKAGN